MSDSKATIAAYDLAFQISPIILQGGIASKFLGGALPILALTFPSALSGSTDTLPRFVPVPGSSLINTSIGHYPLANAQIAANAVIQEPLTLGMRMISPVNTVGGYLQKLALFTALQASLQQHNNSGGWYSVATPAFVYNNLLMVSMTDVTPGDSQQQQIEWQLDFVAPIISFAGAAAAQANLLAKVTSGSQLPTNTSLGWSGLNTAPNPANTGLTGVIAQFGGPLG